MAIHSSVLELVGNTPIIKARNLDTGVCELYLKLESANPGGSIKDRIGMSMIEAAEKRGDLKPGATLVEGTAGNTGLGLALVKRILTMENGTIRVANQESGGACFTVTLAKK